MAKVRIEFETDNEAFATDLDGEITAVLKQAFLSITGQRSDRLHDSNGNTVGRVTVEE